MDAKNGGEEEEESNHAPVTRRGKKRGVGKRSVSLNAKVIFQYYLLYFTLQTERYFLARFAFIYENRNVSTDKKI